MSCRGGRATIATTVSSRWPLADLRLQTPIWNSAGLALVICTRWPTWPPREFMTPRCSRLRSPGPTSLLRSVPAARSSITSPPGILEALGLEAGVAVLRSPMRSRTTRPHWEARANSAIATTASSGTWCAAALTRRLRLAQADWQAARSVPVQVHGLQPRLPLLGLTVGN